MAVVWPESHVGIPSSNDNKMKKSEKVGESGLQTVHSDGRRSRSEAECRVRPDVDHKSTRTDPEKGTKKGQHTMTDTSHYGAHVRAWVRGEARGDPR